MTDRRETPRWPEMPSRNRQRITSDVDDEIQGWLAERAAEWRDRGVAPEEAMRRARQEFGDVQQTRDYCVAQDRAAERQGSRTRFLREARDDVRIAARSMARSPALAVVLLVTMALGIGATTSIYSVVHALLLRPLPWVDADRVVQLHATEEGLRQTMGQLSARAFVTLRENARSFAALSAVAPAGAVIAGDGEPESVSGLRMSANTLDLLGVRPLLGAGFASGADSSGAEPVVIMSHALWQRRFGADPSVIGRTLDINGVSRRVLGVMPPGFIAPLFPAADLLYPLDISGVLAHPERKDKFRYLQVLGRIPPGREAQAQADAERIMARLESERPEAYRGMSVHLVTVREEMTGSIRPALVALAAAAGLLLLIACANIASVLLARLVSRQPELGVRVALGAGRGRLVRQLLAESLALALLGGALGVAVAAVGIKVLRAISSGAIPNGLSFGMESPVLWAALLMSVACGVLFGTGPAVVAGLMAPRSLAIGGTRGTEGRSRLRLRRSLVVTQVALSVAMLMGAGLLGRSLQNLLAVNLGYRTEQLVSFSVNLPTQRYEGDKEIAFYDRLLEELRAIPGVTAVAAASSLPLTGSGGASFVIEGRPFEGDRPPEVRYAAASEPYFEVMGIPIVQGRAFRAEDAAPGVLGVIISQATARRFWGTDDPIGARVRIGPDPAAPLHTVVGVAGDVVLGPKGDPVPTVYSSMRYDQWGGGFIVMRTSTDAPMAPAIRRTLASIDPLLPANGIRTLDELRSRALADYRLPLQLVGGFSVLAVVLASLGLYGVGSNLVASRRRELGVRMALGATSGGVLLLILRDGLLIVAIGVAVGVPLALYLGRQMTDLLYGVGPTDPLTLGAVAVTLGAVGVLASAIPAHRASRVDPAEAIRPD